MKPHDPGGAEHSHGFKLVCVADWHNDAYPAVLGDYLAKEAKMAEAAKGGGPGPGPSHG